MPGLFLLVFYQYLSKTTALVSKEDKNIILNSLIFFQYVATL